MDEKLAAALAQRLAAYSATASVALAVAPDAGAQVVYHDFEPDLIVRSSFGEELAGLDFDIDEVVDLELFACSTTDSSCGRGVGRYFRSAAGFRLPAGANAQNGVMGYEAPGRPGQGIGAASRLSAGDIVGNVGGRVFYTYAVAAYYYGYFAPDYPFNGEEGYVGFRFVAGDGLLHYGWLRLSDEPDDYIEELTIYEYAYEATPEFPIRAGAVSAALLDGALSPTTIPADGGTLGYAYTVTNTTDEPLETELWVEIRRAGRVETVLLSTLALPAGGSLSDMASWAFPGSAPGGRYDVRFKLGTFASGAYVTFERFEVTKDGVGVGIEEDGRPVVGTHALSEAVPNPASERTHLTLEVTEAQHVRVAVHDALGREVAVLHDGALAAGEGHQLVFDGSGLPSGVYVVRAVGAAFTDTRVVSLTR